LETKEHILFRLESAKTGFNMIRPILTKIPVGAARRFILAMIIPNLSFGIETLPFSEDNEYAKNKVNFFLK
jgi:hypothetical protein